MARTTSKNTSKAEPLNPYAPRFYIPHGAASLFDGTNNIEEHVQVVLVQQFLLLPVLQVKAIQVVLLAGIPKP